MGDGILDRWRNRRMRRAFAPLKEASRSRWQVLVDVIGPTIYRFLETKWRFPPQWDGNNGYPPRPRSTEQQAAERGMDPEKVRKIDWEIIDLLRDVRRTAPYMVGDYLTVPIDAAQDWWDERWSWFLRPDGSAKPKREQGPIPSGSPSLDPELHELEDEGELVEHMRTIHGFEAESQVLSVHHRAAHEDEAQDREWDRLFRTGHPKVE